jgi:hypothetical protein
MVWFTLTFILSAILDIITVSRQSNLEKDLETLIIRQHLFTLQRKHINTTRSNLIENLHSLNCKKPAIL